MIAELVVLAAMQAVAAQPLVPTQEGIVYGEASGETLTMDYYAPKGPGVHPIAIIIHGGGYQRGDSKSGSEAYCAQFLAPAGYAVFSINYRLAPKYPYPYMVYDVQRSVRFIRHNAQRWNADPNKIALVGGSAGGFLSNMAGLLNAAGDPKAKDPVDRESARAQAVVTLYAQSSFANVPLNKDVHALLDPLIQEKGLQEALHESAPITYVTKDDPPFLLIQGDRDEYIPFTEDTNLQMALRNVGVRCDLIRIPGGQHGTGGWHKLPNVPDWEREMVEWLNARFDRQGPVGEGNPRPATGLVGWAVTRMRTPVTLALMFWLGANAMGADRILVHGHRGARARKPENTLPAFEYAIRAGVDALEMDMAVTKDGIIVISHDPILQPPVCSGPESQAVIHTRTLKQVKKWDCGGVQNPHFPTQEAIPGTRMPTLDEVFALAKEGAFDYNIETKSFPNKPEYTPEPEVFAHMVLQKIRQYKLEKRVILQSFDFRTLIAMNKLAPEIRLSALIENDTRAFPVIAAEAKAGIISPHFKLVTPAKVAEAHAAHLQVVPWTADTPEQWDQLIEAKVDAIISDDPAALLDYLKNAACIKKSALCGEPEHIWCVYVYMPHEKELKLDLLQGTLDVMVLQTLATLGRLHGYGIARRIEQVSGDQILLNQGTIYAALVRLQQRGWIAAEWGISDNNRKAKFYCITKNGQTQLASDVAYWRRLAEVMGRVLAMAAQVEQL